MSIGPRGRRVQTPDHGYRPIRLGLLADYPEEGWPSMDLTAAMIYDHLILNHTNDVDVRCLVPRFRHRVTRFPGLANQGVARNLDRMFNRFWDYPQALKSEYKCKSIDLFHLTDHSYSQLVHALPKGRAVITCHDLDTFRCLLDPQSEPRSRWFRIMVKRILDGFRQAAAVVCVSEATRQAILAHNLLPSSKVTTIPNGIAPEFTHHADPIADAEATRLLGPVGPIEILHVGSTIPRKRIDVLLEIVAAIRVQRPEIRLIKVGGPLNNEQSQIADSLGLRESLTQLPFLTRATLAAVYRRSALVLQPSDSEGFGLPVAEAMACGTVVVASDIEVLREVGGSAATYCPAAQPHVWAGTILGLLNERSQQPEAWQQRQLRGLEQSRRFSWSRHASQLVSLYQGLQYPLQEERK